MGVLWDWASDENSVPALLLETSQDGPEAATWREVFAIRGPCARRPGHCQPVAVPTWAGVPLSAVVPLPSWP